MRVVRVTPNRSLFRYALIAIIAFSAGSASVVIAADPSHFPIFRLGDATDSSRIASVDESGSLHVSQQGTIAATLTNTDFPDAATHTKLDTTNTQLGRMTFDGSGNLKTTSQGTAQVTGSVSVSNLPAVQQVGGSVSVSNLPAVQSGVTVIPLATQTGVASGSFAEWKNVDVSSCRSFSIVGTALGSGLPQPPGEIFAYIFPSTGGFIGADIHLKTGGYASSWAFVTQPGTNEPLYATNVTIQVKNSDGSTRDMSGEVQCMH